MGKEREEQRGSQAGMETTVVTVLVTGSVCGVGGGAEWEQALAEGSQTTLRFPGDSGRPRQLTTAIISFVDLQVADTP